MVKFRSGHIVAISSIQGKVGIANRSTYAASKHAIIGYFDSMRAEVPEYYIDQINFSRFQMIFQLV
jgi:short-subunit dehydrogenase